MDTQFYISINLKTWKGLENFAKFSLGNNRKRAYEIFTQLKGSDNVDDKNLLCLEFMEIKNGLPANLKIKSCTLKELSENCGTITKEVFKYVNMEE